MNIPHYISIGRYAWEKKKGREKDWKTALIGSNSGETGLNDVFSSAYVFSYVWDKEKKRKEKKVSVIHTTCRFRNAIVLVTYGLATTLFETYGALWSLYESRRWFWDTLIVITKVIVTIESFTIIIPIREGQRVSNNNPREYPANR